MATVAASKTIRKSPKSFFAHLYDEPGVLSKIADVLYFVADGTGTITVIEPDMCSFLAVLGEIGVSETQALMDRLHGGAATICTSRPMLEV